MSELTDAQRARFSEEGYLLVGPLIAPSEVATLRSAFEDQARAWAKEVEATPEEYLEVVSQWTNVWEKNSHFKAQLFHPRAATIAAELIGCEQVRVFHDHLIVKPPMGGSTIPWHRDLPNWPIAEPRAVSCWLALDEVTLDSGAMRFMPGGHREPISPSIDFLNAHKTWEHREGDVVPVPVPAGWALFHHCLSWHMSPPNRSEHWRRAYITIYLDGLATFDPADRGDWHPMTDRVTVAPGEVFNEDAFPTLGGRARP